MQSYSLTPDFTLRDKYRIKKVLGQGGFGITYLAEDSLLDIDVCIKELFISGSSTRGQNMTVMTQNLKEFSFNDFKERFIQEAKQLARFGHPNIVRIMEFFEANNTAYVVMEYIAGKNLKDYIAENGVMTELQALPIIHQLFDAVEEVHNAGMLHRDLKPDNILLTAKNRVVLIDFGSAREFTEGKTITQTAMLTPGFAPIEQYSNRAKRGTFTDIYALGATLYFMLTGHKPIAATDRYREQLPAPHQLNPQISTQLSSAVMMAMEMKEEDRFQSVGDFRLALQQLAGSIKKKEAQKTVVIPKKETVKADSSKNVQTPETSKKNNKVLMFSVIGAVALVIILFLFFNPFFAASVKRPEIVSGQDMLTKGSENKPTDSPNDKAGKKPDEKADDKLPNEKTKDKSEVKTDNKVNDNKESNVTGSVKEPVMVQIPGKNYKMGKYEVTQEEWESVMGSNPSNFKGCPNCPVEQVSWNDVQVYIQKLNKLTGKQYRLPNESEWEHAARAGTNYEYTGSDNIAEVAWYDDNSNNKTHFVGQKKPNNWGLYDMSGNVREWCQDLEGSYRVLRGGSWFNNPQFCRVSFRFNRDPDNRTDDNGFRLVLAP